MINKPAIEAMVIIMSIVDLSSPWLEWSFPSGRETVGPNEPPFEPPLAIISGY